MLARSDKSHEAHATDPAQPPTQDGG